MVAILVLVVAALAGSTASIAATTLVAVASGLRVKEVAVTFGEPIFRCRFGVVPIVFGWLPWGGSVSLDEERARKGSSLDLCVLYLSGVLGYLVLSAICIRYDSASAEFVAGFRQIVMGALSPLTDGKQLVHQYHELSQAAPVISLAGLVVAKFAVINALPIPPNTGGLVIWSAFGGNRNSRGFAVASFFGFLVLLTLGGSWLVAISAYAVDLWQGTAN